MASSFPERRSPSQRFLPPDPRVAEPYRFTPQLAIRVGVLGAIALAVFAVLFLRLWALQVLAGDRYLHAAQQNQVRTVRVEAPRGTILDRSGRTLVSNVPGTAVKIWTADLPDEGRYAMFKRLSKILQVPLPRLTKALEERKDDPLTPILVKTAVHEYQVAYLWEHRSEFPGVEVVGTYLRDYEYRALAAQLLGYVGEISPEELEQRKREDYRGGDKIGKTGVESAFDGFLRGRAGAAQIRVDSLGRPQGADRAAQGGAARLQRPADDRRRAAAGGRARAPARDRAREGGQALERERRRDRRDRPARRRDPRARVQPDLQAVASTSAGSTRRSSSRSSIPRSRRSGTTRASTARSPASIRPARPSSRSPRSPRSRTACSRPTSTSSARRSPTTGSTSIRSRTGTRTRTSR